MQRKRCFKLTQMLQAISSCLLLVVVAIPTMMDGHKVMVQAEGANVGVDDLIKEPYQTMQKVQENVRGFPLLDALIASSAAGIHSTFKQSFQRVSLDDLVEAMECVFNEEETNKYIINSIPQILNNAMAVADSQVGRIIETVTQEETIGENYKTKIRGVAFPCSVVRPLVDPKRLEEHERVEGAVAYGAYLVESTMDFVPDLLERDEMHIDLLLQADVVEFATRGLFFVPREYCMDFGPETNKGIAAKTSNSILGQGSLKETRNLVAGTTAIMLSSIRRSNTWNVQTKSSVLFDENSFKDISAIPEEEKFSWIQSAFEFPKLELLAFLESLPDCKTETLVECKGHTLVRYAERGVVLDSAALDTAFEQVTYLGWFMMKDWLEKAKEENPYRLTEYTTPFLFEPHLATPLKNAGFAGIGEGSFLGASYSRLANPYYTNDTLASMEASLDNAGEAISDCFTSGSSDTTIVDKAQTAMTLAECLQKRLLEVDRVPNDRSPLETFGDWGIGPSPWFDILIRAANQDSLSQKPAFDDSRNLLPGNLTERRIGKTADWMLMSNYSNPQKLRDLFIAQLDTDVYQRAQTKALESHDPCGGAADNSEIFLYVLGMVTAACGGVNAILGSLHSALHWVAYRCFRSNNARKAPQGVLRILPTYELVMMLIGSFFFLALFVPVIVQYEIEKEIQDFRTHRVDMEALIDSEDTVTAEISQSVIITLVEVETFCEEARPDLLLILLVIGLVGGILINIPFLDRVYQAWARYLTRLFHGEDEIPANSTVHDESLSILTPASNAENLRGKEDDGSMSDHASSTNSVTDVSILAPPTTGPGYTLPHLLSVRDNGVEIKTSTRGSC